MGEWIACAERMPERGVVVLVKCESHPEYGEHAMLWNVDSRRWEGMAFALMGSVSTCWDESAHQPSHWRPAPAGREGGTET